MCALFPAYTLAFWLSRNSAPTNLCWLISCLMCALYPECIVPFWLSRNCAPTVLCTSESSQKLLPLSKGLLRQTYAYEKQDRQMFFTHFVKQSVCVIFFSFLSSLVPFSSIYFSFIFFLISFLISFCWEQTL